MEQRIDALDHSLDTEGLYSKRKSLSDSSSKKLDSHNGYKLEN